MSNATAIVHYNRIWFLWEAKCEKCGWKSDDLVSDREEAQRMATDHRCEREKSK